ncbi:MAG TPA: hypothetical protein VLZ06_06075 [Solirubrobacteraceae bacterium]|nr:hypothetical protein [Solirubrobacteraceae bacterium]
MIDRFEAGVTIAGAIARTGTDLARPRVRSRVESAVLELLEDAPVPAERDARTRTAGG